MHHERRILVPVSAVACSVLFGMVLSNWRPSAAAATQQAMRSVSSGETRIPISELPYRIAVPGSYLVTQDLTGLAGQDGISIESDDVTVDLDGYSLHGGGGGSGITVPDPVENVTVVNGIVEDWEGSAIGAWNVTNGRFQDLVVAHSAYGLSAGINCVVVDCTATSNFMGIRASSGSIVRHCCAWENIYGIEVSGSGTTLLQNQCSWNIRTGIWVTGVGNVLLENQCSGNWEDGIRIEGSGNRIDSNHCWDNAMFGIVVSGAENVIIRNTSRANAINYVGAGDFGPLGTAAASMSPWANL